MNSLVVFFSLVVFLLLGQQYKLMKMCLTFILLLKMSLIGVTGMAAFDPVSMTEGQMLSAVCSYSLSNVYFEGVKYFSLGCDNVVLSK